MSVAYNPELNGHAKRQNRTHIKGARIMLKDLDLGKDLWGKALSTHVYICNCCPSNTLPGNITLYDKSSVMCHLSVTYVCSDQSVSSKSLMKLGQSWMTNQKNVNLSAMKETPSMWS